MMKRRYARSVAHRSTSEAVTMRNTMPVKGHEDEGSSLTGQHSNDVPMPPGWRILAEGEESVVSFLRAEGETDSGIEVILGLTGIRASGWTNTVAMRGRCE